MDVSIIIVNYNTFKLTSDCIRSVYEKTKGMKFEVILVDNGSTEVDPNEFCRTFPDLILIVNSVNEGFGRANNRGMEIARGRYFLLLNSDSYFMNNAAGIAFDFAAKHADQYAVFGASLYNEDLSEQRSYYKHRSTSIINTLVQSLLLENVSFRKLYEGLRNDKSDLDVNGKIGGLYGAYIFLERRVYEDLGGFDPDFFMYCEDTEWFRNRVAKKYNVGICRAAKVVHLGNRSSTAGMVKAQNVLSYYLYWYKIGYFHYAVYVSFSYVNVLFNLLVLPFMSAAERKRHYSLLRYRVHSIKQVLFDIPRYSNRFNSRKSPLVFNNALKLSGIKTGFATKIQKLSSR